MPAEAIHLTALDDTLVALPRALRLTLTSAHTLSATRLGAMFVDLPYFEDITSTLLRHCVGLRPRSHAWGDVLHQQAPIALGLRLGELGAAMQRRCGLREAGQYLTALSLGYICHAALDTALHPLVNQLAAARADRQGDHPLRQHREVEKYQSVLFHQERHGQDYLGSQALHDFLRLDAGLLWRPGPIGEAVQLAMRTCLGAAPLPQTFRTWERGYARYLTVLCGPLGRHAISAAEKERERAELYDDVAFAARYTAAVARSVSWVSMLAAYLSGGTSRDAMLTTTPEQSLDRL